MKSSSQIHFRAEFTIEEGRTEEYKKLVQEMSRVVQANEPDTIDYQFYLNRDDETSVLYTKRTQTLRRYLLTMLVLHRKQYFQRFPRLRE